VSCNIEPVQAAFIRDRIIHRWLSAERASNAQGQLNTQGQAWGLAGTNPAALIESGCEPFREVMRASMHVRGRSGSITSSG
jgi:hypothetical protein